MKEQFKKFIVVGGSFTRPRFVQVLEVNRRNKEHQQWWLTI